MSALRITFESEDDLPVSEVALDLRALDVDDIHLERVSAASGATPSTEQAFKGVESLGIIVKLAPTVIQAACETVKAFFARPQAPQTTVRIKLVDTEVEVKFNTATDSAEDILSQVEKLVRAARRASRI